MAQGQSLPPDLQLRNITHALGGTAFSFQEQLTFACVFLAWNSTSLLTHVHL